MQLFLLRISILNYFLDDADSLVGLAGFCKAYRAAERRREFLVLGVGTFVRQRKRGVELLDCLGMFVLCLKRSSDGYCREHFVVGPWSLSQRGVLFFGAVEA